MKKILFSIIVIITSFIFIDVASAMSVTIDYSNNLSENNYFSSLQLQSCKELKDYLDTTEYYNREYDYYIKTFNNNGSTIPGNNYCTAFLSKKLLQYQNYTTVARFYNRSGYTNQFNLRWYEGVPQLNGVYTTRLYPTAYNNTNNSDIGMTKELLEQYRLNNQTPPTTTSIIDLLDFSYNSSSLNLPNSSTFSMLYYSSVPIYTGRLSTENNTWDKFDNLETINNESGFDSLEDFGGRFYSYFDTITSYAQPGIDSFGNGQYGIISNNITIDSQTSLDIMCPDNTDFIDNYCYINQNNYSTDSDVINDVIDIKFNTFRSGTSIPFVSAKYYIFSYRVASNIKKALPTKLFVKSGSQYYETEIVKTNIISSGSYDTYQVVFTPIRNDLSVSISELIVRLPSNEDLNVNPLDFNYGVYNIYKYTEFGTSIPNIDDLNNDLNNNSIDDLSGNLSYFKNFSLNNHGLSSIITAPLRIFTNISNNNNACSPLTLTIPINGFNQNITIPCIREVIHDNLGPLFTILQLILSGFICYRVALGYFKIIKDIQDPTIDVVEVIDL